MGSVQLRMKFSMIMIGDKIKLEVIAEDTRFIPWEDRFLVKADKKVYVQIKEQKEQMNGLCCK